jgi:hypothetical protein
MDLAFSVLQLLQRRSTLFVEAYSSLRQSEAACCAIEEPDAQVLLQPRDVLTDDRAGKPELLAFTT